MYTRTVQMVGANSHFAIVLGIIFIPVFMNTRMHTANSLNISVCILLDIINITLLTCASCCKCDGRVSSQKHLFANMGILPDIASLLVVTS